MKLIWIANVNGIDPKNDYPLSIFIQILFFNLLIKIIKRNDKAMTFCNPTIMPIG